MMKGGPVAVLLVLSVLVLAGCASATASTSVGGTEATIDASANSGGTSSTSGWKVEEGKLKYEIREQGGRGGRRR